MEWTYMIRQKLKVAALLGGILFLIGLTNFLERRNLKKIDQSFSSIYYDRLIPATDIFYLTSNLYNKRLLIEKLVYASGNSSTDSVLKELQQHKRTIDDLVVKFEKTELVAQESIYLAEFKRRIQRYQLVEDAIVERYAHQSRESARALYEHEGRHGLQETIQYMEELTKIQSAVGLELIQNSKRVLSSSDGLLTLQIATAIIIGALIQVIVAASKTITTKKQPFHLN